MKVLLWDIDGTLLNTDRAGMYAWLQSLGEGVPGHHLGDYGGAWNEQDISTGIFEPLRVVYQTDQLFPCTAIDKSSEADKAACFDMPYDGDGTAWQASCEQLGGGGVCRGQRNS